jgi:hypothetical protein
MARFNGHRSWNAWNVSLWINNDESLYRRALELARRHGVAKGARIFARELEGERTPDGGRYNPTTVRAVFNQFDKLQRHPHCGTLTLYRNPEPEANVMRETATLQIGSRKNPPMQTVTVPCEYRPLWWHTQGLSYTASGYGRRIPSPYMVRFNNRWRRVYVCQQSNAGTAYIVGSDGEWVIVRN